MLTDIRRCSVGTIGIKELKKSIEKMKEEESDSDSDSDDFMKQIAKADREHELLLQN